MGDDYIGNNSAEAIKGYLDRVLRLEEEKSELMVDIREVYAEAKGNGFDVKTLRQLVRLSKMNARDRVEQEELLRLYRKAIGMDFME